MTAYETARSNGKEALRQASSTVEKLHKEAAEISAEKVDELAGSARDHAVDFTASMRRAFHAGAESLRDDGYESIGDFIDMATARTKEAESRIGDFNPAGVSNQVSEFVRERPLIAYGGLALAGFLLAAAARKQVSD
jgi:hypothetical protein